MDALLRWVERGLHSAVRASDCARARNEETLMHGVWPIIFLAVVLKIPVGFLLYTVWWAVKATPEAEEEPADEPGGKPRLPPLAPRAERPAQPAPWPSRPRRAAPPGVSARRPDARTHAAGARAHRPGARARGGRIRARLAADQPAEPAAVLRDPAVDALRRAGERVEEEDEWAAAREQARQRGRGRAA